MGVFFCIYTNFGNDLVRLLSMANQQKEFIITVTYQCVLVVQRLHMFYVIFHASERLFEIHRNILYRKGEGRQYRFNNEKPETEDELRLGSVVYTAKSHIIK